MFSSALSLQCNLLITIFTLSTPILPFSGLENSSSSPGSPFSNLILAFSSPLFSLYRHSPHSPLPQSTLSEPFSFYPSPSLMLSIILPPNSTFFWDLTPAFPSTWNHKSQYYCYFYHCYWNPEICPTAFDGLRVFVHTVFLPCHFPNGTWFSFPFNKIISL